MEYFSILVQIHIICFGVLFNAHKYLFTFKCYENILFFKDLNKIKNMHEITL